ncbi:Rha family transcriptional regulator [Acinetobacter nosocomialis]
MNALVNTNLQLMSSKDLLEIINTVRAEMGEPILRLNKFNEKIEDELDGENYTKSVVQNSNNTTSTIYELTIDQCTLIGMRESKAVRKNVLAKLKEKQLGVKLPQTYIEALKALVESEEQKELIAQQRDHAIATKAEISDKKTATAMATASVKSRQAEKLKEQIGESKNYASVKAVEKVAGGKYNWRELKKWCLAHGKKIKDIADANYGSVKIYHKDAWKAVYGINLTDYFAA